MHPRPDISSSRSRQQSSSNMDNATNSSTGSLVHALRNLFNCFPLTLRRNVSVADDLESGRNVDHGHTSPASPRQAHTRSCHVEPQPYSRYYHNGSSTPSSPLERPGVVPRARAVIGEPPRETARLDASPREVSEEEELGNVWRNENGNGETTQESANNGNVPPFRIPQRHLLTIAALFGHPEVPQRPNGLDWSDFISTMAFFGFAIDGSGPSGSRVKFMPMESLYIAPERRGCNFTAHRPHGAHGDRISRAILQDMGRDLTRIYGWSAEMFTGE
jgi:hypothetical protein